MSFTTLAFAVFLPIVFVLYWFAFGRSYKWQNAFLLLAGYVFYGWWDWRFLGLIFLTTFLSWICALARHHRKLCASISVVVNLAVLCLFKYLDFFGDGLSRLMAAFGFALDWFTIDILLPVGISFYTFQAIGYSIDVYKKRVAPERNFISFSVFIAFFPQLVAGPIERAADLLPQFNRPRRWDYGEAVLGMRQILWGLFKKCVVADGISFWVTNGYLYHLYDGYLYAKLQVLLAAVAFALQIYGDFSGYSDIARGSARLLGIRLMDNFLYPFFSRNALELWHRWHRSLMLWLRDYVYIPLGGSRSRFHFVNIFIVFLLSGLWHGASVNFLIWGALCGVWYLVAVLFHAVSYRPFKTEAATLADLPKMAVTFLLFVMVFVSFRVADIPLMLRAYNALIFPGLPIMGGIVLLAWFIKKVRMSFKMLIYILTGALVCVFVWKPVITVKYLFSTFSFIAAAAVLAVEWKSRNLSFGLEKMPRQRWLRNSIYILLYFIIFVFAVDADESQFIYFQF